MVDFCLTLSVTCNNPLTQSMGVYISPVQASTLYTNIYHVLSWQAGSETCASCTHYYKSAEAHKVWEGGTQRCHSLVPPESHVNACIKLS